VKVLLAIETSGKYGSVAIAKAHNLLQKTDVPQNADLMNPGVVAIDLPTDRGSAQSLASSIDFLLRSEKLNPNDLGCIAVLSGPGSFTGLFVGPGCERLQRYLAREEKLDTVKKWFESVEWINDWRSTPHASSVAELGWRKWSSGDTLDPFLLLPEYFRGSAAEEKASKPV